MLVRNVSFGICDPVSGDRRGEDDFLDAEFASGFDDVVRAHCVDAEGLVVGNAHWLCYAYLRQ